jgi:hypothetical protein
MPEWLPKDHHVPHPPEAREALYHREAEAEVHQRRIEEGVEEELQMSQVVVVGVGVEGQECPRWEVEEEVVVAAAVYWTWVEGGLDVTVKEAAEAEEAGLTQGL